MSSLSSVLATKNLVVGNSTTGGGSTSNTFTGTGDPGLTRAQHIATTYVTPPNAIRTTGYDTVFDHGEGLYVKVNAEPNHLGKFQTTDGTWYELKPEYGKVWAAQFGAKPTVAAYNSRENDIAPALNAAVDYIVFSRWGGADLHIHGGTYYLASTIQLKGASFNIRGVGKSDTFIMPEAYVTGFVAHHPSFSFEAFGSLYYNNRGWAVGETWYTSGGTVGTPSGHCYICTVAGVSSVDGSQKPTGTGTGYIDGTAHFDYYREATRVELTTSTYSGEISNLALYSHYDQTTGPGIERAQTNLPAVGPWPQFGTGNSSSAGPWKPSFGFLGRCRAHVHHCSMDGFSAHGCAFIANGDFDFPTISGNVNFWCVTDCSFYYNTMDGFHVSYSDGNTGYAAHIDLAFNGRFGVRDQSFLGNMYVQLQSAADGRATLSPNKRFSGSVTYAGYRYYALLGRIGASGTPNWGAVAPSGNTTSNSAWGFAGGDGTLVTDNWDWPDWGAGKHYEPSGAYGSDNINARNVWNSVYIEGGTWPAQFNAKDIVIGGLLQGLFIGAGQNLLNDGVWYNPVHVGSRAHSFSASLGTGGAYSDGTGEGVFKWNDGVNDYTLRTDSYENSGATYQTDNYAWAIDRAVKGYWLKNGQTSKFYGKPSAADGGTFVWNNLIFGSDGDGRQHDYADAVPNSGAHGRGEVVWNRSVSVGQPKGWMCTVAGTPGTWVSMGNL